MSRPRLLVLSFSPISTDARVLKQVQYFVDRYDVTTCGYGPAPAGVRRHLELPAGAANRLDGRLITARAYRAAYWRQPAVRAARALLRGTDVDAVLANDLDALPLALALHPRGGVHADLHEYFPRLHEENEPWRRRIGPYMSWLCRRYLPRAASVSTVSGGLAREYEREFGVPVQVVTNATPFADLAPTPVAQPVRLVHSGACLRSRNIHLMVEAMAPLAGRFTLDLYLTPNHPDYLAELRTRAAALGNVTVHDPVPYPRLVQTLHRHDLGVFVLPPVSFSYAHALPNKVYDFAQARLGVVVGPSPEMVSFIEAAQNGVVTGGFTAADLTATLGQLTPPRVAELKAASHAHARDLSAEAEVAKWGRAVARLVERAA
ncbi:glycosyltransferase family 1 protein [Georgenia sp. TF02-10]|uniref:glycosyltransferase n=1 Tax=Georgenia sp. TF02-10 TaxID=2917725 RepID=UPI001FA6B4C6|nr:glycosyltransferase [Georgenia sp. TF02-10]UNX55735.1 glycosyltransferase family 1 protein [Georgenia sp. TF02-10]